MITYSRNAARATIRKDKKIARVNYHGPICMAGFVDLVGKVIAESADAKSLIARLDTAAFCLHEPPPVHKVLEGMVFPPSILVVSPHQYSLWTAYARQVSKAGVSCAIFAVSQLELAERLALVLAT